MKVQRQAFKEAKCIMECAICGKRSKWATNNRVIYPDHTLWCSFCGEYRWHTQVARSPWRLSQ